MLVTHHSSLQAAARKICASVPWHKLIFLACLALPLTRVVEAQTPPAVRFLGVPAPVFTSGIQLPIGMAVDPSGNVYIAEYTGNAVYKETLQPDGTFVRSTVAGGFPIGPVGLAIDSAGNVYVGLDGGSSSSSLRKETLQPDGTYVESQIGTGLQNVYGVAVDPSDNVYAVSNTATNVLMKFTPSGSSYTSTVIFTPADGLLAGVTLDNAGNLFVVKEYSNTLYKLTPSGSPATTSVYSSVTITTSAASGFDVAVDTSGDLFLADTSGSLRLEAPDGRGGYAESVLATGLGTAYAVDVSPSGLLYFGQTSAVNVFSSAAVNLGARAIRTAATAVSLVYVVEPGTPAAAIHLVDQGVLSTETASPEFVTDGSGTCTVQTYSALTTCTVAVTFRPQYPGLRTGAVQFLDSAGNLLNTAYLYGVGNAPVATFSAGAASVLAATGLGTKPMHGARGPVFDSAGNLYLADSSNNRVVKVAPGGAATALSTAGLTLSNPAGLALDGAGNLYIADSGNGRVVKLTAQGAASVLDTNSLALSANYSVAVDYLGNVYTSDADHNRVLVFPATGAAHVLAITGVSLGAAYGVAADSKGNLFIADNSNARIVKVSHGTGTIVSTGTLAPPLLNPESVFVDAVGNLYVTDTGNNRVITISASTENGIALGGSPDGLNSPDGAAVDNAGSLAIADSGHDRVVISSLQIPAPLALAVTGATQSVYLLNQGNVPLTLAVPLTGQNPGFGSNRFDLVNAGEPGYCPQLSTSGASTTLGPGQNCLLTIELLPPAQGSGSLTSTLTVTDNTMAVNGSTQVIALNGNTQRTAAVTLTASPASPIVYGQALTSLAAAVSQGSPAATGVIGFYDNGASLGSAAALSGGSGSFPSAIYLAGSHSFEAEYSGDANYHAANSAPTVYVVSPAGATIHVLDSSLQVTSGVSGSVPVTVSGQYSGAGILVPSGSAGYSILNNAGAVVASGTAMLASGSASVPVPGVLPGGLYVLSLSYPGDANYNPAATSTAALHVGAIVPVITWAQPPPITYGTPLGSTLAARAASGAIAVQGTFAYTATLSGGAAVPVAASTVLPAGSYSLAATFTPAAGTNYAAATATVSETIQQGTPVLQIASSDNPVLLLKTATFSASVAATTGQPSGTVTFLDGALPLGSATLSNGTAVLATASLTAGSHSLSALYNGDSNYARAASSTLGQAVLDFTATTVGGSSVTVAPGSRATVSLAIAPSTGTSLPASIVLSLTGLPTGATATVSAAAWVQLSGTSWSYPANTPLGNVPLIIQLPALVAHDGGNHLPRRDPPLLWCLLLLPFVPVARANRALGRALTLLALAALCFMTTGCGAHNEISEPQSHTYSVQATVSCGALSHAAAVSLTVE